MVSDKLLSNDLRNAIQVVFVVAIGMLFGKQVFSFQFEFGSIYEMCSELLTHATARVSSLIIKQRFAPVKKNFVKTFLFIC